MNRLGRQRLRPLGGVAHHQHRLAQAGRFLLDTARVRQDNSRFLHQVNELQILQRLDKEEILVCRQVFAKDLVNRLAHIGIQVHRINKIHIRILLRKILHRRHHADETFAEILPAMAGDQHQLLATRQARHIIAGICQHLVLLLRQGGIIPKLLHHHVERINHRIARHEDLPVRLLLLEILLRKRRGRKIVGRNPPRNLPVHLLRPGTINIMRTQTSLHVPHRNLLIERRQGGRRRRGGIAMHQHHIRLDLLQHITHPRQHTRRHVIQVLPLLHDIQIIVRSDLKNPQHLVQHLAMLPRHTHDGLKLLWMLLELLYQRTHFDGLGPRPEHQHYFLHLLLLPLIRIHKYTDYSGIPRPLLIPQPHHTVMPRPTPSCPTCTVMPDLIGHLHP